MIVHVFSSPGPYFQKFYRFAHNLDLKDLVFLVRGWDSDERPKEFSTTFPVHDFSSMESFRTVTRGADGIILHSLTAGWFTFKWLSCWRQLARARWVIWGGDLYRYQESGFRMRAEQALMGLSVRRLKGVVCQIPSEGELAKEIFRTRGDSLPVFYPSYVVSDAVAVSIPEQRTQEKRRLLVGNSGDPSNLHREVFQWIHESAGKEVEIHCPLTYGDRTYIEETVRRGQELFGPNFHPILHPQPFEKYMQFLETLDGALFNHRRQQGMGNILVLLAMGKPVFMNARSPLLAYLASIGTACRSIGGNGSFSQEMNSVVSDENLLRLSAKRSRETFSEANCIRLWNEVQRF